MFLNVFILLLLIVLLFLSNNFVSFFVSFFVKYQKIYFKRVSWDWKIEPPRWNISTFRPLIAFSRRASLPDVEDTRINLCHWNSSARWRMLRAIHIPCSVVLQLYCKTRELVYFFVSRTEFTEYSNSPLYHISIFKFSLKYFKIIHWKIFTSN